MAGISLYDYQLDAVNRMRNGCILCGDVGSGKSRTGIAYYYTLQGGQLCTKQYVKMKKPKDLYIITTARKRDTKEWEGELAPFLLSPNSESSAYENKVVIDSWNNIAKYVDKEYFYGGNRSFQVVRYFQKACLHHIHNNPHHWQYWVLINDEPDEGEVALEMPYECIIEMICDWWAFSWQKGDLSEIFSWYDKHQNYIKLASSTRRIVEDILWELRDRLGYNVLAHHGIKGQKWGVRNGPPYPLDKSSESGNIKDVVIGKSLGAKSHNYDVLDPNSNEYFQFSEGTRIRHAKVFAGKGASKPLNPEVAEGLSEQIGGDPDK